MDALKSAGGAIASNLGFISKAILEFEDCRELAKAVEDKALEIKGNPASATEFVPEGADVTKMSMNDLQGVAVSALGIKKGYHKKREGTKYLRYEVLFNPKEISLNGRGEAMVMMHDKNDGTGLAYRPRSANLEARIPLIVDRTLSSKISMGVEIPGINGSLSSGADALINNFKDGSIQKEVEAFIALLQSVYTKRFVFYWGNMVLDGILSSVNATYQIFDPNGNPTRASIDLHAILASDDYPVKIWDGQRSGPWKEYYDNAFDGTFISGVKGSQWGSNLLNL